MSVTGHVGGSAFSLRATAGIRTPWRQQIEGSIGASERGSLVRASVQPSRVASVYFSGASGIALVVAAVLSTGAIVSVSFAPAVAGQLAGGVFGALFFGGVFFGIGRWSCRLGLNQAERLIALVDEAAATLGADHGAP